MLRCCLYAEMLSSEESESELEMEMRDGGDLGGELGGELVSDPGGEMVGVFTRGMSGVMG